VSTSQESTRQHGPVVQCANAFALFVDLFSPEMTLPKLLAIVVADRPMLHGKDTASDKVIAWHQPAGAAAGYWQHCIGSKPLESCP
jgi:hypothetical protein